jgi:major membrane immunogen (membrane-anchored lipoprotein)
MKKTLLIVSVVFSVFLLVGCGQAEKIKSGKIASVKATVISTSHDKDGWFTLIPMATVIGKNGKNVNGPDKNCPVLPNAYGCHLNSRIIRSFISV